MIYVHFICPQSGNNFPLKYECERKEEGLGSPAHTEPYSHEGLLTPLSLWTCLHQDESLLCCS